MPAAAKVTRGRACGAENLARKKGQTREPVSPFLPHLVLLDREMCMEQYSLLKMWAVVLWGLLVLINYV